MLNRRDPIRNISQSCFNVSLSHIVIQDCGPNMPLSEVEVGQCDLQGRSDEAEECYARCEQ